MKRVIAFGNCDAASALMLMKGEGCDALILSNPWTFDEDGGGDDMPAEAIRSRYVNKLRNPAEIKRLLTGGVSFSKLFKGLLSASRKSSQATSLANELKNAMGRSSVPHIFLIADNDRTGLAFVSVWQGEPSTMKRCKGASHAYVEPDAAAWLEAQILETLQT